MSSTSVIKVGPNLIATIPNELEDAEALELQVDVSEKLERTGATGVLLDLSALETVDSFLGRLLHDIASCASLLGADTVISGMHPAVAITLVELGLRLDTVRTALDAERGLALLAKKNGRG